MMSFLVRKRSLPPPGIGSITKAVVDPVSKASKWARPIHGSTALPNVRLFDNVSANDSCLRRNRKLVSKYVGRIGRQAGLQLALDSYGFCYIPFRRFLIMIEVPADEPHQLHFHTMIFDLSRSKGETRARKKVSEMQLRRVCLGKNGSTLTLDDDEVFLCYSRPIKGLSYSQMLECLEDFMETALNTHSDLAVLTRR
jgi:hypothetical protein